MEFHESLVDEILPCLVSNNGTRAYDTFNNICQRIMKENELNWGRIVSLFFFVKLLINRISFRTDLVDTVDNAAEKIGIWTGEILARQSHWIQSNGGWDGFITFFGNKRTAKNPIMKAIGISITAIILSLIHI